MLQNLGVDYIFIGIPLWVKQVGMKQISSRQKHVQTDI